MLLPFSVIHVSVPNAIEMAWLETGNLRHWVVDWLLGYDWILGLL